MKSSMATVTVILAGLLSFGSSSIIADTDTSTDESVLPGGLGETSNGSPTFGSVDLLATSIQGMLDPGCGGYCVIGACAHLRWRLTWSGAIEFYTVVSPKLRHAYPELLVSSYTNPGEEPFDAWRASFGSVMGTVAESLLISGGRANPVMLDLHQSGSFKEVDIIGHPLTALPPMLDRSGTIDPNEDDPFRDFSQPPTFQSPDLSGSGSTLSEMGGEEDGAFSDIDIKKIIQSTLNSAAGKAIAVVADKYELALQALQAINIINDLREMAEYFKSIATMIDAISAMSEASVRGTIYGNLINPRFLAPRLFCPVSAEPLQPYYLSFADIFWWRSGFPVTDGPLSGENHMLTILNPASDDTLPEDAGLITDFWGHLYPREGTLNQTHDAKAASILAWRGMDVLHNSLPGHRIGVPLPPPAEESEFSIEHPRWQMIYPEVKSCETTPYYASDNILLNFMKPNEHGGYAWNYYRTYTCCSNKLGTFLLSIDFPIPLCITLGDVEEDAKARADDK